MSVVLPPRTRTLLRVLAGRVPVAAAVVLAVGSIVFFALSVLTGDAATQLTGANGGPEQIAALRRELGLDRPVWVRWLEWLAGLPQGDLGRSLTSRTPVGELVGTGLGHSALIGLAAGVIVVVGGLGLGLYAGLRQGARADRVTSAAMLGTASTPEFVTGSVLILIFAAGLGWLPAVSLLPTSGNVLDQPEVLVLPVLTVAAPATAVVARLIRAVVAEHAGAAHVEAATLDGLSRSVVVRRHLLPGAWAPVLQVYATVVPYLVGGAVVVEQIFGYPGLGQLLVTAVASRDSPVVAGAVLVLTAIAVSGYLVADVLARVADPRTWAV